MLVRSFASFALLAALGFAQDSGQALYRAHCQVCHGAEGLSIPGVNLRSGQFRRASTDEELSRLIQSGIPGTGMPPTNLSADERRGVVAYLRSMHTSGAATGTGDPARGLAIFEGKGGCVECHRAGDKGSRLGPDLSGIGTWRVAETLEKAVADPHASIAPENRFVRAVTRSGAVIEGRRLNEDTHTIQLIDRNERLISLDKSEVRELTLVTGSAMPSYRGKLSAAEMADLVSYLLTLKGSQ